MLHPRNRVLQVDSGLLDDQVDDILLNKLNEIFNDNSLPRNFQRFTTKFNEEIKLSLKLILYKLFIIDRSTTYGLQLQNLKLVSNNSLNKLTKIAKLLLLSKIISSYLDKKLNQLVYDDDEMDQLRFNNPKLYSLIKQYNEKISPILDKLNKLTSLFNTIIFLIFGDYISIFNRLFNIRYEKVNELTVSFASNPQSISYEFQDRQLIWNTITEVLSNISLPNISNLRKYITKNDGNNNDNSLNNNYKHLPERYCAICFKEDEVLENSLITNAYKLDNCGHIYCYLCLMRESKPWNCLRCGVESNKISVYN